MPESVRTERRMGNQSADWTLRYAQQRPELIAQLESLRNSDRLAAIFDFDRMIADLRDWDGSDLAGERYDYRLTSLISRGIATARFVRYIEGSNAG